MPGWLAIGYLTVLSSIVGYTLWFWALGHGGLPDIAPTVLDLMGLPAPAAMSGSSLAYPVSAADATPVRSRQPAQAQ